MLDKLLETLDLAQEDLESLKKYLLVTMLIVGYVLFVIVLAGLLWIVSPSISLVFLFTMAAISFGVFLWSTEVF